MKKVKVTILPYIPPKKSERTFLPRIGSVAHVGRKQVTLRQFNLGYSKSRG